MTTGVRLFARAISVLLVVTTVLAGPAARHVAAAATCVGSTGPGIPPLAGLPAGLTGFHARWHGQSGYPTLCPGERSTATVAYYNSGSLGWVRESSTRVAYLRTWGPEPGQDRASSLGGDGTQSSPNTNWPRYNRTAIQPAVYVGPAASVYGQGPTANAPITAGVSMFMLLMQDGAVLDTQAEQTAKQQEKGLKGSLGTDGTVIYLVVVGNANITDSQYVLQALGVRDAINLDGGGTAALWIDGGYTVGPGRLLPNAILLTKP